MRLFTIDEDNIIIDGHVARLEDQQIAANLLAAGFQRSAASVANRRSKRGLVRTAPKPKRPRHPPTAAPVGDVDAPFIVDARPLTEKSDAKLQAALMAAHADKIPKTAAEPGTWVLRTISADPPVGGSSMGW